MRALKTLVIVMGALILLGIGVLGVTIYNRATRPGGFSRPTSAERAAERVVTGSLGLPAGSHIRGLVSAGNRVVVHVELPDGSEELLLLDPVHGRVVGRLGLSGTPGAADRSN